MVMHLFRKIIVALEVAVVVDCRWAHVHPNLFGMIALSFIHGYDEKASTAIDKCYDSLV